MVAQATIRESGCLQFNHPLYDADVAQRGFHFFSNLKKQARGKKFVAEELIVVANEYFHAKTFDFYKSGTVVIRGLWQRAITAHASYFE